MRGLAVGEVHVWCAAPGELERDGLVGSAQTLLAEDEIKRLGRFRFARHRLMFLATRALVRQVLSRYAPVAPEEWTFVTTSHGRPEIARPRSPLRFNLSNTDGLVVCAVTHGLDVGVDVESLARPAPIEMADRFFAPAESRALHSLPVSERARRFFDYWTLKEAYLKARGFGLNLPLDAFAMLVSREAIEISFTPDIADDPEGWRFSLCSPSPSHRLAIADGSRATGGLPITRNAWPLQEAAE